ncbi:LLM class flavin-dependent oxidoreductase [Saccharothrix violaceirubra]|uniref:Natural product biosynthesis luciferase-like monooxygenase protein n=1 Tax=Saccharothrix violaceirubra TaxID=413306 RepID=A0A7W7WWZ0_9PSEU|nr:MupA/Atu3671 family FMN-dependent luciferase-like monooxygenase [Saccharothrix violaceirubra]MBB4966078.1 natural product biosynthesis luciferase-like monooxygenase protein [Saccharothrix violaceirubra]
MDYSLFYFADDSASSGGGRYRLLLDGAKFADEHGFTAVWTPERHFHRFGGLYPNPAVTGAAVAAVTSRVGVRAGSVVAPLHHPLRIAEEWSVVDNLSGGRVGLSFASGWNANDFVLAPEKYADRKRELVRTIDQVRSLWRGGSVSLPDGAGSPVSVRVFPPPVRAELPIWTTSAGSTATFRAAGEAGTGVLTHLLGQELDRLTANIAAYRAAHLAHHGTPGHVVLMVHAFLGPDADLVRERVREPLVEYLKSSFHLIAGSVTDLDPARLRPADIDFLIRRSYDRYYETSGLFGTVDHVRPLVERFRAAGVDELACLIDFGLPFDAVLDGLTTLDELRASTVLEEAR